MVIGLNGRKTTRCWCPACEACPTSRLLLSFHVSSLVLYVIEYMILSLFLSLPFSFFSCLVSCLCSWQLSCFFNLVSSLLVYLLSVSPIRVALVSEKRWAGRHNVVRMFQSQMRSEWFDRFVSFAPRVVPNTGECMHKRNFAEIARRGEFQWQRRDVFDHKTVAKKRAANCDNNDNATNGRNKIQSSLEQIIMCLPDKEAHVGTDRKWHGCGQCIPRHRQEINCEQVWFRLVLSVAGL